MGSSSSKRQHHYSQTGNLVHGGYAYPSPGQGQFGYYIQQVGSEPTQVRAIPGYYYHPGQQAVTGRPRPRKHNSVPALSNSFSLPPQPRDPAPTDAPPANSPTEEPATSPAEDPATSPAEEPATSTEPSADPPGPSGAPLDAPSEDLPDAGEPRDAEPEPQPVAPAASTPALVQPELTNPLPSLPRDVFDTDAYRHLHRAKASGTTGLWQYYRGAPIASVSYKPHLRSQHRGKGSGAVGLPRPPAMLAAKDTKSTGGGGVAFKLLRSLTMPTLPPKKTKKLRRFTAPPHPGMGYPHRSYTSSSRNTIPAFTVPVASPPAPSGRPIVIPLSSPLNPTSRHRITYKKKEYPTAAHLFEAQKFLKHSPELAERIRMSDDSAAEMSKLSRVFQMDGMVRGDWELVWKDKIDEVLYLKFTQHPKLQADLLATGFAPLVDGNDIRPPDAEGANELGKALVRLREKLRRDGGRVHGRS